MQRLLNHARWDADQVRDDLRGYVVEHLATLARCWWSTRPDSSRREPPRWACNASTSDLVVQDVSRQALRGGQPQIRADLGTTPRQALRQVRAMANRPLPTASTAGWNALRTRGEEE